MCAKMGFPPCCFGRAGIITENLARYWPPIERTGLFVAVADNVAMGS